MDAGVRVTHGAVAERTQRLLITMCSSLSFTRKRDKDAQHVEYPQGEHNKSSRPDRISEILDVRFRKDDKFRCSLTVFDNKFLCALCVFAVSKYL
jgi:hypothetical protein